MGPLAIIEALALGARNMVMTAMLLVSVGLIVMVVETTGIGNTLSLMLADWAGGSLMIALVLVALASLVLGMGLPVTAAYIVLATLSAPALFTLINNAAVIDMIAAGTLPRRRTPSSCSPTPTRMAKLQAPMTVAEAEALSRWCPPTSPAPSSQALSPAVLTGRAALRAHDHLLAEPGQQRHPAGLPHRLRRRRHRQDAADGDRLHRLAHRQGPLHHPHPLRLHPVLCHTGQWRGRGLSSCARLATYRAVGREGQMVIWRK
jgi:hypothetical protein